MKDPLGSLGREARARLEGGARRGAERVGLAPFPRGHLQVVPPLAEEEDSAQAPLAVHLPSALGVGLVPGLPGGLDLLAREERPGEHAFRARHQAEVAIVADPGPDQVALAGLGVPAELGHHERPRPRAAPLRGRLHLLDRPADPGPVVLVPRRVRVAALGHHVHVRHDGRERAGVAVVRVIEKDRAALGVGRPDGLGDDLQVGHLVLPPGAQLLGLHRPHHDAAIAGPFANARLGPRPHLLQRHLGDRVPATGNGPRQGSDMGDDGQAEFLAGRQLGLVAPAVVRSRHAETLLEIARRHPGVARP